MKTRLGVVTVCLAVIISGCVSHRAGPIYHAGDENPPDFVVGAIAAVLTNLNDFSANVLITTAVVEEGEGGHPKSGILLEREGKLLFQPTLPIKGKRARREGGLFFIWDETKHSGYVLSDALQGDAPIHSDAGPAGPAIIKKEGIQEEVTGHPCHRCEAIVPLKDGHDAHLTLWQADDLRHFPVRIEEVNGPDRMTLDFSNVRFESPNAQLFSPPDGFTAYANSIALMNELIVRETAFTKKDSTGEFNEPADVRTGGIQQPPPR